jgi:acetyl-CoA/propionyl-CoA carboxylase
VALDNGVASIADNAALTTLYADMGKEITAALCRMGGETVGLVALNGKLTADGARKAARLVSFCDSFSIPVVTLVDSEGVEYADAANAFAKLAKAYITATTAKVTAVIGKAYGAAFTLMGSHALGADLALALEGSVISVLAPETAVAFAMNDKITDSKNRADVEAEWKETYASPVAAAESGDIDDVIPEAELRARIISALYMLAEKADGTPDRKHGVPTL